MRAEDSGYYTCTATNTGGFDTIIVNLLVQGEWLRSLGDMAKHGLQRGKKAVCGCGCGEVETGKLSCAGVRREGKMPVCRGEKGREQKR